MNGIQEFSNDEEGYRKCLKRNPNGFVANRRWGNKHLVIHKANCPFIKRSKVKYTNPLASSSKICCDNKANLVSHIKQNFGSEPNLCKFCNP